RRRPDEDDEPRRRSRRDDDEDDRPRRRARRRHEDDDDEDDDDRRRPRRRYYEPSRGGLTLTLGILSVVLMIGGLLIGPPVGPVIGLACSLPAWIIGQGDRRRIQQGRIAPSDQGLATAGWVCGIVGTLINGLLLLCGVAALVGLISVGLQNQPKRF